MTPDTMHASALDLNALQARMRAESGPTYWRSLDELAGRVEIDEFVHREFPGQSAAMLDPVSRRNFMHLMGASMMLAGLAGCTRQPLEKIVPYVKPPEHEIPGKPQYYATAMPFAGYGMGLVATSFQGRPTKLEGLKEHPSSLGATDLFAQASILDLYDPDRQEAVSNAGALSTWTAFFNALHAELTRLDADGGEGFRILTESVSSPTFLWQMEQIRALYPKARWHQFEPVGNNARIGAQQAFGRFIDSVYDFSKAKVVVALDADFLHEGPAHVRHARDFAAARDFDAAGSMNRLYAIEATPTLTGAHADHKVTVRFPEVEAAARAIANAVGITSAAPAAAPEGITASWLNALVDDLNKNRGAAVVVAGPYQPPVVHSLAHAINEAIGAVQSGVVTHIAAVECEPVDQAASIRELTADLNTGGVKLLLIIGGNPVYNTPADLEFAKALKSAPLAVHLTRTENETSRLCHWTLPEAHYLEAWSDVRAHDGTVSIIQPLILPLYSGKSVHELFAMVLGQENPDGNAILQESWKAQRGADGFDRFWKVALSKGIVEGTSYPVAAVTHSRNFPAHAPAPKSNGLDVIFRLDPTVYDGRFSNNGWLQEIPKPLTRLTWDNAVHIHPRTAAQLHLEHEDEVDIEYGGRTVRAAVMYQFGHPKDAITLHVGYGRTHAGRIGTGRGFNAYALQSSASPWFGGGASLRKTNRSYRLARTEEHWNIEQSLREQGQKAQDRFLIREAPLGFYTGHKDFAQHMGPHVPDEAKTLYKPEEKKHDGFRWGMAIDLNKCTGCNVCVIACQSENNIPIVGKQEVLQGREMHWIRIDRYYKGNFDGEVDAVHQPVPCMQCENAPCEPVCPVGATSHSKEGLNDMAYNRCVGTRYCANNCPYKVRRFNFFHYNIREGQDAQTLKMLKNPNVTVRARGVMEKCTYCVQRINIARIDAKVRAIQTGDANNVAIPDGAVVTACQAACPSNAITFGDIGDPESRVAKDKQNPRNYGLLADIGTRPRTSYLARLKNPSPALAPAGAAAEGAHESVH